MQQAFKTWLFLIAMTTPLWASEEQPASGIEYLPLQPKLVVNLVGRHRYLRADVQLMIQGKESLERIQKYLPAIRHALIMQLSSLPPEQASDVEAREKIRQEALQEVRKVLEQYAASDGLKDLFFTEFLLQ